MSTHARAATAAIPAAGRNPFRTRIPASALVVFGILLLSGCVTPDSLSVTGRDPSDPAASVPPVRYRSTTAAYVSQRPVAPGPWRRQNERVTPQPKSEQ